MRKLLTIIILLMSVSICQGQEQKEPVSPCWYGLDEAKTDVERFYALYNTHVAALELGVDVNYDGVDKLDIEPFRQQEAARRYYATMEKKA